LATPKHHKEIANFLKNKIGGDAKVVAYRDNNNANPVPVGLFGSGKHRFISTIGALDRQLDLPTGHFEFASYGGYDWLPNVVASSIYWLKDRTISEWPLVCEDVVKDNTKSTYRHMAYVPSVFSLLLSTEQEVKWLLGVPITDSDITISASELYERAHHIYPEWLFHADTCQTKGD